MATTTAATTVDTIELENQEQELDAVELEQDVDDQAQDGVEQEQQTESESKADAEDDNLVVAFDGEEPEQEENEPAPQWVKELRKTNKELSKRNKELEERLNGLAKVDVDQQVAKPTMEECEYDEEIYERRFAEYLKAKEKREAKVREQEDAARKEKEAWDNKLIAYSEKKQTIKAKDFDEAEERIQGTFRPDQLGIVIHACDNPPLMVYALGKNPKLAKSLSEETDLVQFAFKIAKLEAKLKVVDRKAPPPPEAKIRSSGVASGAVDLTEERLRDEALRTGDLTKLTNYLQDKRKRLRDAK